MSGIVPELVKTLGISPPEARRRLCRAVAAVGGASKDLAPLLGCSKRLAREAARRAGCRLMRNWEHVGATRGSGRRV